MSKGDYSAIHACACTDTGRARPANEDALCIANLSDGVRIEKSGSLRFTSGPQGALFAVADGMGGAAAGETASRLGLKTLYREVQELVRETPRRRESFLEDILIDAVAAANRRVFDLARHHEELAGMGTTLTTVLEFRGQIVTGQIGDSRAYLLHKDGIRQLTRDQSLVGEMLSTGRITEDQARRHPERNILLQALGVRPKVELELRTAAVRPGDVLLLCSDGLHTQMSSGEIYDIVANSASLGDACLELVDLANERGGPDNITAVLIQFLPD